MSNDSQDSRKSAAVAKPERYSEDELLPLSGLQHLIFCERQCALIHVEQVWTENRLTVEGRHLHDRVHDREHALRGAVRVETGVALRSLRLGLSGVADVVEFRKQDDDRWLPFPVEYKRGRPKEDRCDEVQLCAQAMCLEEMMSVSIEQGALFYGKTRRRKDVCFDDELRVLTTDTAARFHALVDSGRTPPPAKQPKCRRCSLVDICLPDASAGSNGVEDYLAQAIQ